MCLWEGESYTVAEVRDWEAEYSNAVEYNITTVRKISTIVWGCCTRESCCSVEKLKEWDNIAV